MALSKVRPFFGVHSFTPYNRTTGEYYGTLKVLQGSSISLSGETVNLTGGSQKFPWAVEDGLLNGEIGLTFSEYPDFLFELFLGKAPTANAAEAAGSVSGLADKNGTSLVDATTGVASIAAKAGSEADLKFGKYILKAASATTVDVYLSSDIDITRGTDGEYQNDLLKVTTAALTVPGTGGTVDVPNFGLEITGGSGAIAMTAGDTAEFEVRPINAGSMDVTVGGASDLFPEFGAIIHGQKLGDGRMVEVDCFRLKALGLPLNFAPQAFSEAEVTIGMVYDSTKNGVFKMRHVEF